MFSICVKRPSQINNIDKTVKRIVVSQTKEINDVCKTMDGIIC